MQTINASDFKARCLAILDRVHETGERVVILKRGRPVAELSRVHQRRKRRPPGRSGGNGGPSSTMSWGPVFPEERWDSLKR